MDDHFACVPLPFNFCFFGNVYNEIGVGGNGAATFDSINCDGFMEWMISAPIPSSIPVSLLNCIMAPWQDFDATNQGGVFVAGGGSAPNRYFTISWYNNPMYGDPNSVNTEFCDSAFHQTQMIVLYETTNIIEVHIHEKATCPEWNGGLAIEGIQNAFGTIGYAVPGRNATQWNAVNDAWRFTPVGHTSSSFTWYIGNNPYSMNPVVEVCPTQTTTYIAVSTFTPCDTNIQVVISDTFNVSLTDSLRTGIDSTHNLSCNGNQDGAAFAYVISGTPPVTYGWSNGSNTLFITNLSAGTYVFTVTDAVGCLLSDTVNIAAAGGLFVTVPDVTATDCSDTASIAAIVSGGTPAYSYLWNNAQNTSSLSGISSGTYSVTVTDAHLCTAANSGILTVVNDTIPLVANPITTNVSCFGLSDGSISPNINDGITPYSYIWSNGDTTASITNLTVGTYFVTVTDAAGCTLTATDTINQPSALSASSNITNQIEGGALGDITQTISGGTAPYSFVWSNGNTTQNLTNINAGYYQCTITDSLGCQIITNDSKYCF